MLTWQGFLTAAAAGALGGTAVGIVPLAFGLYRRRPRAAVGGLVGCIAGGAIGGIYGAIAGMAVSLGILMRREDPEKPLEP